MQFRVDDREKIKFPKDQKPVLLVVIDTEEEFDWAEGFSSHEPSVSSIEYIFSIQRIFDDFGITPVYVVDYPIAENEYSVKIMSEILRHSSADIGAHLQPWVNPPLEEVIGDFNSYPGNLSAELELRKLISLCDKIEENFGIKPKYYKAGRYGLGPNTYDILARLGFELDLSISPGFDFSGDGGPDYSRSTPEPYYVGVDKNILEVPTTGGFLGLLGKVGHVAYPGPENTGRVVSYYRGLLAKTMLLQRSRLSPEGHSLAEQIALTQSLMKRGVRVFNFSFHSPSLKIGCTEYVSDENELKAFLDSCRGYFQYFAEQLGGKFIAPADLIAMCEARKAKSSIG